VTARVVERAKIILLAAEGQANQEIAETLKMSRRTTGFWRHRFAEKRLQGIEA
jgi:DNA-binding NarL/FixJ family response regulator